MCGTHIHMYILYDIARAIRIQHRISVRIIYALRARLSPGAFPKRYPTPQYTLGNPQTANKTDVHIKDRSFAKLTAVAGYSRA